MRQVDVLNHGYVRVVESWGADHRIIEAARMSTDKGFLGWERETLWECKSCIYTCTNDMNPDKDVRQDCPSGHGPMTCNRDKSHPGDVKLLSYLYTHKHMTPFEFAGLVLQVQAPIFVFREWHRHRTQSYNELSARYTEMPELFYDPTDARLSTVQDTKNKQASTDIGLATERLEYRRRVIKLGYTQSWDSYQMLLKDGTPREVARIVLPVGMYSRMRAATCLRNWLAFLTLRMDPAAQFEIRCYANAVGLIIEELFPRTWELFNK